jgi:hypothetical protein
MKPAPQVITSAKMYVSSVLHFVIFQAYACMLNRPPNVAGIQICACL